MQPETIGWVAGAALLVGAFVRLLKSDTFSVWLANVGLAPIPGRVLPWVSLALGLASSVLDVKVTGADWYTALVKGLIAGMGAIVGHETVIESARKGKEILPLLLLVVFAASGLTACASVLHAVEKIDADIANCLVASQNLPDDAAFLKCGVQEAERELARNLLHASRAESAKEAVQAVERAKLGCAPPAAVK